MRDDNFESAVDTAIDAIQAALASGVTVATLNAAKIALITLAARTEHFNFERFPLPEDASDGNFYLVHGTHTEHWMTDVGPIIDARPRSGTLA